MKNERPGEPSTTKFIAKVVGLACVSGLLSLTVLRLAFNSEQEPQIEPKKTVEPVTASLLDHRIAPADNAPKQAIAPVDQDSLVDLAEAKQVDVVADAVAVAEVKEEPTDDPNP
ncbi:hypothetical protein [Tautonia plasticadhaerens]|uniref:hypothetical protein n=1 Tax=Tautonia plasticadhaerens TaxID=2527974 RepID=UPI0011A3DE27|nr:hypothetical protein [Tautonia plasticadhaerens]